MFHIKHNIALCLSVMLAMTVSSAQAGSRTDLSTLARKYGYIGPVTHRQVITLRRQSRTLIFEPDSRKVIVDGIVVWLHEPMTGKPGNWSLTSDDADKIVAPLMAPEAHLATYDDDLVVLDPGHGGEDDGALGNSGSREKEAVLDIAVRVRNILQKSGVRVKMTRDNDTYVALDDRCKKANGWDASLFVSIHLNRGQNPDAQGVESFAITAKGRKSTSGGKPEKATHPGHAHEQQSTILAHCVHRNLLATTQTEDRGLKRARFSVLRGTDCPSVLLECGFLSNSAEEARLKTPAGRRDVADGIANGILLYLHKVKQAHSGLDRKK